MAKEPTGTLYLGENRKSGKFPKEFRRTVFARFDKRFSTIFGICAAIIFTIFGVLSIRKPSEEMSDKEIKRIQERYARLVLDQAEPKEQEIPKAEETATTSGESKAKEEEKEEIDRKKESYQEKQERKAATSEERRQKRQQVAQQVERSGIFAAITAAGGSGSGVSSNASDLLAASGGLENMANIGVSKGTFATKNVDATALKAKRGEHTSGVDIESDGPGTASGVQVASNVSVNISSAPPEVTGESADHAQRSQAAIQRIVNRESRRLKRVFEDWLKRDPALGGKLTVKFTILPSGAVSNAVIVKSTTNNSDFDQNILRYIKRWEFAAATDGGPVEVLYPFVFEGST
jgi:TonB family protein